MAFSPELQSRLSAPEAKSLETILTQLLAIWPEHAPFLQRGFDRYEARDWPHLLSQADAVLRLSGPDLTPFIQGYRWMCDRFLEEELHFRRTGRYRLSSFAQVQQDLYSDREKMTLYMRGLLLSGVLFSNHVHSRLSFERDFLALAPTPFRHLEVGPGHGFYLHLAAADPRCHQAEGWDISATSLDMTRNALKSLGLDQPPPLLERDIQAPLPPIDEPFDTLTINEVLEHLEHPEKALRHLYSVLKPGGRLFVGLPVNSPAPDHIYQLHDLEGVTSLVAGAGFEIEITRQFPATGFTLEQALKRKMLISCVVIARRPG
ncbi:MAG: class I SAM-dependent methyltransferase [Magnetococcales bacterium]|nr:class I SAM-dependent methyltransferase [Magnetococcales bacterium]